MTEVQEQILINYIPEYEDIKDVIEQYSDYELNLIINNLPDSSDDLQDSICKELQWEIVEDLCGPFINNWDDFFYENEGMIMDYLCEGSIIGYNGNNQAYEICKETVIDLCSELISEAEGNYTINEKVNFSEVIVYLNRYYPVKFCEV